MENTVNNKDHPLYHTWRSMRRRCTNPNHNRFQYYGGRGIRVCDRWDHFNAFVADVGPRPAPGMTMDRRDYDGDYEPGNVFWVDAVAQARNRSNNIRATIGDQTKLVIEWAEEFEISPSMVAQRIFRGWTIESALYFPPGFHTGSIARKCKAEWPSYLDAHRNIDTAPVAPV